MKAIVFVDVQKDFIDGALRNETAIEVTPKIAEFAKECMKNGYKIYATRDTHEKTKTIPGSADGTIPEKDVGYLTTLEGQKLPIEHCIEGTDGWMIDNRLLDALFIGYAKDDFGIEDKTWPLYNCTFVNKPTFGSFDLAALIEEDFSYETADGQPEAFHPENIEEIVLCGFCTDICVVSNALLLRAKFPNTKITVKKDLCAGVTPEAHEAALKVMMSCQIDIV